MAAVRSLSMVVAAAAALLAPAQPKAEVPQATRAQTNYLIGCAGCHGIQGIAESKVVPQLRDKVGHFLCSEAGRAYVVQLPNTAFADVTDAELADMMNFVMFGLGGESSRGGRPYTAEEVGRLRRQPLVRDQLLATRASVIAGLPERCRAVADAYNPDMPGVGAKVGPVAMQDR